MFEADDGKSLALRALTFGPAEASEAARAREARGSPASSSASSVSVKLTGVTLGAKVTGRAGIPYTPGLAGETAKLGKESYEQMQE